MTQPNRGSRPWGNRRERYIEVILDPGGVYAEVGPYRARGLFISVGAKPVWLPNQSAWSVSYKRGIDAIALAERFGYVVVVRAAEEVATGGNRVATFPGCPGAEHDSGGTSVPPVQDSTVREVTLEVHQPAFRADGDVHPGDHHDDHGVGLW